MRRKTEQKKVNYSSSLLDFYNYQHDYTTALNEADELELEANRLKVEAQKKRDFATQRMQLLIDIANKHYNLNKLTFISESIQDPSEKLIILAIIETYNLNDTHTESTVIQLSNIDPELVELIKTHYPLTPFGRLDIFITSFLVGRK